MRNKGKLQSKTLYLISIAKQNYFRNKESATADLPLAKELDFILKDLTPLDLRILIKSEEELDQCQLFTRIFPTATTSHYLRLLSSPLNYSEKLLDAFEQKYGEDRHSGRVMISGYCEEKIHLM